MKAFLPPLFLAFACWLAFVCCTEQTIQSVSAMQSDAMPAGTAPSSATSLSTLLLPREDFARVASRLDRSLIPNLVDQFKPNGRQSFLVKGRGFPAFSIVPVRYESTSADSKQPSFRCGVYVVPAAGAARFVRTLGYDNREAEICGDLLGVGFLGDAPKPPRVILLYNGGSFNSPGKDPVILDWDVIGKGYVSNDKIVNRLNNVTTVAGIKSRLKALTP